MCAVTVRVTLLVLLAGATRPENCSQQHGPTIAITSKQNIKYFDIYYDKPYGGDMTLHCSANSNLNLSIETAGNCLETEKLDDNSIFLNVENPNLGHYKYVCKDNQTGCEDAISVHVIPSISATSPSIRQIFDVTHKRPLYFVPIGETYEIICSADRVEPIVVRFIEEYRIKRLPLITVNTTTAHGKIHADKSVEINYYCYSTIYGTEPITVLVDHYPSADSFWCILYQYRRIECTWSSYSKSNSFKLYYKQAEEIIFLCTDDYRESNRGCASKMPVFRYNTFSQLPTVSLILETCNEVFCDNQTFPFNADAIVKLDPISELQLLNSSTNSASVSWQFPSRVFFWHCEYKVEYRLLAMTWQQLNTSSVQCGINACEFQLSLPCPDSHYELRVSVKLKTALGDRFWSDPTSIFFFTDPNPNDGTDPMCIAEFQETEPLPSVEVVLFKVRELIRFERKVKYGLTKKMRALKRKIARVRDLTRLSKLGTT